MCSFRPRHLRRLVVAARNRPERRASDSMAHYLASMEALRLHPVRACSSPAEAWEWWAEHERLVGELVEEVRRAA